MPKKPPRLFTPDLFTGDVPEKIKRPYRRKPAKPAPKLITPPLDFNTEVPVKNAVHEYLAAIGRRGGKIGGKSRSAAKVAASRVNALKK